MKVYKIGIVGGGAAGLMAAISAAQEGCNSVALFEGNVRCGTKILMSGGSRCNVTNYSVKAEDFFGGSKNFIKNVLHGFTDKMTIKFFEELGVKLKLEPAGKYFPEDDKASSVLHALLRRAGDLKVNIIVSTKIEKIEFSEGLFSLTSGENIFKAEKVILTTGGKSYPTSGSDGGGYSLAKSFGHTLVTPFPALTPILLNEEDSLTKLSGVTIPARLTIYYKGKKHIESENSLLFTHFGLSGPAALNISREVERLKNEDAKLFVNFIPRYSFETLSKYLKDQIKSGSDRLVLSLFKEHLPLSLAETIFSIAKVPIDKKFYSLSKEELKCLVTVAASYELKTKGVRGFNQAEVTAGGIPVGEVKYQTMESKLQNGLFLAGEILDVDGLIGGYNFQWAWSTGFIAGHSAAREAAKKI
ncbi:MAG: NAD(P)/FAD-dependent oxidoreductase [Bacteroidota bacterium]|nr:NAD(P)/FAD-dependent oxidoreductase [Bacteroidota bacterium]